ncbi:RagB/SusD family nutrient uptake outer membrane protein [Aequorivita todarodis]|uniref:RagB/SusD family nutrient uptake outer membrane protein n=1 Tax=Aequorivita todarodis TaxID=2036821 RepID=UPI002350C6E9|nr:RagB/SusD family nutrient uptake outer membrane protein [Aequorivita todarodis]MDC8000110.1 RagB/SusD family nutrient uptake outer membrane protein [Aequorivita todarodis]
MKTTLKNWFTHQNKTGVLLILLLSVSFSGCDDFLEVDAPLGQIPHQEVFTDEATATAATTSLYGKLRDLVMVSGSNSGMGVLMGLYADELDFYGMPWDTAQTLYFHNVLATDPAVQSIWDNAYNLIYMCNAVLEGLENADQLPAEFKQHLRGEALFVRGLVHFYLVNLFGDIPYPKTTDYQSNGKIKKIPEAMVYDAILDDLSNAKGLLGDSYITGERTRANSWAVSALIARVYLYLGRWQEAEAESGRIINNASLFTLETELNNVFLKESRSAILQLKPQNPGSNSQEASTYIFDSPPPPFVALSSALVASMQPNDLRKTQWIGEVSDGSQSWYYAYKYKQQFNTGSSMEYSIVLRLAEQYLIRAEARANQNNIAGAQQDINAIRLRAGLDNTQANTPEQLRLAILQERRFELFAEHGHRWFDIRRFGMANEILSPIKTAWKPTDVLLPIPESDLLLNPNLAPQNPGY